MARAYQHAAVFGDQWKHVAGAHEVGGADIAVGERTNGVDALLGRNAGAKAVAKVDRYSERRSERRVVDGNHRIEPQAAGFRGAHRRANDAAGVADNEGHLLGRAKRGGDEEIALVLAIVVIGDDNHLTIAEGFDRG